MKEWKQIAWNGLKHSIYFIFYCKVYIVRPRKDVFFVKFNFFQQLFGHKLRKYIRTSMFQIQISEPTTPMTIFPHPPTNIRVCTVLDITQNGQDCVKPLQISL